MKRNFKIALMAIAIFITSTLVYSASGTPNYWKCENRVGGTWGSWGRLPSVCDMDAFLDPEVSEKVFGDIYYNDHLEAGDERSRYLTEVYALLTETSKYYLKERKPNVSNEEMEYWMHAIYALTQRETWWSHFRVSSRGYAQMMRGDYGHGHGLVQIDDRYHFSAVTEGVGANIVMNIMYGLEIFYNAWEKAPTTSCVEGPSDFLGRTRSAYSAYNGGPRKICRWTNSRDRWYKNDKGFLDNYKSKSWEKYVTDFEHQTKVDIKCVIDGREDCIRDRGPSEEVPKFKRLYKKSGGEVCTFVKEAGEEFFNCVELSTDKSCLVSFYRDLESTVYSMPPDFELNHEFHNLDRHGLCGETVEGLKNVGKNIKILKNINLRQTPGGNILTTIPKGTILQVLDFIVTDGSEQKRYYLVQYKNYDGYLYTGKRGDFSSWSKDSDKVSKFSTIASIGSEVRVIRDEGTKLYNDQGEHVGDLAEGDEIIVLGVVVEKSSNDIFYSIGENRKAYAGSILPDSTMDEFFEVAIPRDLEAGVLTPNIWYMRVRSCPSLSCSQVGVVKGPRVSSAQFEIHGRENKWVEIKQGPLIGFIKERYVVVK